MKSLIAICAALCLMAGSSIANNLQVTAPVLLNQNTTNHTTYVQFTLSWDNSFRDVINRDAAWIFIKYRIGANGVWKHATLNSSGSVIPAGGVFDVSADSKGGFLYRGAQGSGSVNYTNVQLQWNYGTDGISDNAGVIVKVFAIEMVYIPQGSFWLGDNTSNVVAGQFSVGGGFSPYQITSEASMTLGGTFGLGNRNSFGIFTADDFTTSTSKTLPAAYPKGYNAFYAMKYKISQQQYLDYLNTLTRAQQQNAVNSNITTDAITNIFVMTNTSSLQNRNTIVCPASGNGTSNPITFSMNPVRNDRACGNISWTEGTYYSDWAGLRPYTEMEYEKICRGDQSPSIDEFVWGTSNITQALQISGSENGTETILPSNANAQFGNNFLVGGDQGYGPLRCGIYAKNGNTREQSGATYYGVMDMSGGLYERTYSVGDAPSRTFDGSNGDGDVSTVQPTWNYTYGGMRGGAWDTNLFLLRVSDRYLANYPVLTAIPQMGFRCVRAAPVGTDNKQ